MSIIISFFKAWMLGFAIAAPVGPIGLLCIRHSLISGLRYGLAVGLGAALADSVYGVLVSGGFTVISEFLLNKEEYIKLFGGFLLIYLAVKEITSKSAINSQDSTVINKSCIPLIFSTFLLTLTNPMTIMSFVGVFSIILGNNLNHHYVIAIIIGVFLGSMSWSVILSTASNFSSAFISPRILGNIKYISATILGAFGIYTLVSIISINLK